MKEMTCEKLETITGGTTSISGTILNAFKNQ